MPRTEIKGKKITSMKKPFPEIPSQEELFAKPNLGLSPAKAQETTQHINSLIQMNVRISLMQLDSKCKCPVCLIVRANSSHVSALLEVGTKTK